MTSTSIAYAAIAVAPSVQGLGTGLRRELDRKMMGTADSGTAALSRTLGRSLTRAFAPVMVAALAAGAFTALTGTVRQAGALEQSIGAIDTIFKNSAGQMHEWSAAAAANTGLARNEYNELSTLIGSQLKNAGTAMEELGPKTNDLITLGADLSSMFGGSSREAVEALSSALKGERDPIERYGVSLKQASIDAKAAELGFSKVGGALSSEANAAATLALIMEQTADAHGNFAKESTTYEGVMQRLSASWANVSTTIGQAFLPFATAAGSVLLAMMPTVQGLADNFAVFGEQMSTAFQGAGGGIDGIRAMFSQIGTSIDAGKLVAALYDTAIRLADWIVATLPGLWRAYVAFYPTLVDIVWTGFYGSLFDVVLSSFSTLAPLLHQMIPALVTELLAAVPALLAAGVTLFTTIVESLAEVIPQVLTALTTMLPQIATALVEALPTLLQAGISLFMSLITALTTALPTILQAVIGVLPSLITTLLGMLPMLIETGISLFLSLVTALLTALPQIVTSIMEMLPTLVATLLGMIPALIDAAVQLFVALVEAIPIILPQLMTALGEMGPSIGQAILDLVPILLQSGKDIMQGLIDGIGEMGSAVLDAIGGIITGAVDWAKDLLGINSPSKVFREFGQFTGEGFAIGLDRMGNTVASSARGLAMDGARVADAIPEGGFLGAQLAGAPTWDDTERPPQFHMYADPSMDEAVVGQIAAERLFWELTRAR